MPLVARPVVGDDEQMATPGPTDEIDPSAQAPVLDGDGVRLRPLADSDADAITVQGRDPEMVRWTVVPSPYPPGGAADFIAASRQAWRSRNGPLTWAIETPEHPYAGSIDLRPGPRPDSRWEIGYALHPAARGQGVLSAALRRLCAWGFAQGAATLSLYVIRGNWASRRVAWACGFRVVDAVLPGWLPARGGGADDAWVATLRPGDPMTPPHPWLTAPQLCGVDVRLRPWRLDDHVDEEPDHPAHWMPPRAAPTPRGFGPWLNRLLEVQAAGRSCEWCIADPETDAVLGAVSLFDRTGPLTDRAELGYQLLPSARGRGLMAQAAGLALAHGLAPAAQGGLELRRVFARTAADNAPSAAVLRALGFAECGRESAVEQLPDGTLVDDVLWERLATGR